ncbi:hypothetical protein ADZ37_12410 [Pannonibacter phragmitetus]|nr:hypothetical protein ADZ37_12410 [Pannonibacter phragmitetus]
MVSMRGFFRSAGQEGGGQEGGGQEGGGQGRGGHLRLAPVAVKPGLAMPAYPALKMLQRRKGLSWVQ